MFSSCLMKYSLDKAISMYYNKNTALNVVLYLSHRELILVVGILISTFLDDFTFPIGN